MKQGGSFGVWLFMRNVTPHRRHWSMDRAMVRFHHMPVAQDAVDRGQALALTAHVAPNQAGRITKSRALQFYRGGKAWIHAYPSIAM